MANLIYGCGYFFCQLKLMAHQYSTLFIAKVIFPELQSYFIIGLMILEMTSREDEANHTNEHDLNICLNTCHTLSRIFLSVGHDISDIGQYSIDDYREFDELHSTKIRVPFLHRGFLKCGSYTYYALTVSG